jgi:hypothetical protein
MRVSLYNDEATVVLLSPRCQEDEVLLMHILRAFVKGGKFAIQSEGVVPYVFTIDEPPNKIDGIEDLTEYFSPVDEHARRSRAG